MGTVKTLLVLLSLPGLFAHAQQFDSSGVRLLLNQAIHLALQNHPSLRAADAQLRAADAGLTQARSPYFPSLSATATFSRTEGAFVFNPSFPPRDQSYNNYTAALQGQQLLYDFGKTGGRVSANEKFVEASTEDYRATRDAVITNVALAYFNVIQAAQVEKVEEEAVAIAADHLRSAKAFFSVGRRPQLDVTRAEVDLANANVNLIGARAQLSIARVQLENGVGVHPAQGFAVDDTFSIEPFDASMDSVKAAAFRSRPDLQANEARISANRALASAAWEQHLPTLSAFGTYTWSNFTFPLFSRWNAGVTLSFPIFQGFAISAQAGQASAAADLAQANADILREAILLDVRQAYLNLTQARERITASAKLIEQAEQNLALVEKQYAAGIGTSLDVSDAQLVHSNARITRIQALRDYNASYINLQRAMGTLSSLFLFPLKDPIFR